jgi:hypothetical protein
MFPQLGWLGRQQRFGNVHHVAHDSFRLWTKRKLDTTLGAEEIRHDWITAALHLFEQQCRTTSLDYTPVNFSGFQVRIDFHFDRYQVVFPR